MGFILTLVALIIIATLLIPSLVIMLFTLLSRKISFVENLNHYLFMVAYSLDQFGNVLAQHMCNVLFITSKSLHHFGSPDETISSVLGKNQREGCLTWEGKALCWILDLIETNHCFIAIEEDENWTNETFLKTKAKRLFVRLFFYIFILAFLFAKGWQWYY